MYSDRTRGFELNKGRVKLDIWKKFFKGGEALEEVAQRDHELFVLEMLETRVDGSLSNLV